MIIYSEIVEVLHLPPLLLPSQLEEICLFGLHFSCCRLLDHLFGFFLLESFGNLGYQILVERKHLDLIIALDGLDGLDRWKGFYFGWRG